MTTLSSRKRKCVVCGTENNFKTLFSSSSSSGSRDLDLRPPEMYRSTMPYWVQECKYCGYVATDISSDCGKVTIDWLKTQEYLCCDDINFTDALAARFYKDYKIKLLNDNTEKACSAIINATWACDDAGDQANAICCRKIAINLLEKMIKGNHECAETMRLMKADLLRRAELFEELEAEYSGCVFGEEVMDKVLAFELEKAAQKDIKCYTIDEAVNWADRKK